MPKFGGGALDEIINPVAISREVLTQIFDEARRTFPAECCGWLSGPSDGAATILRQCENAQAQGRHPTEPTRTSEHAYVIAGEDLLELNGSLDTDTPALVIYHSHPNGPAIFSSIDRAVATNPWGDGPTYPVQQLVVAINKDRVVESALFAWSNEESGFVEIAKLHGTEI